MKQLISGIREVSKRLREIAQTHRLLFGEKSTSQDGRFANTFSSARVPCRTIGTKTLFPTPKLQEKSSIDTPTSTDYCKRIMSGRELYSLFNHSFGSLK